MDLGNSLADLGIAAIKHLARHFEVLFVHLEANEFFDQSRAFFGGKRGMTNP